MNIQQLKDLIAKLQGEIADLKKGDRTKEAAEKLVAKRAELATARTDLETAEAEAAEIESAFEDADGDKETTPDPQAASGPKEGEAEPGKTAEEVQQDNPKPQPNTPSPVVTPDTDGGGAGGAYGTDDEGKDKDAEGKAPAASLAASGADRAGAAAQGGGDGPLPMTLVASGASVGVGVTPGKSLDRDVLGKVLTASSAAATVPTGKTRIVGMERFGARENDDNVVSDFNTGMVNSRIIAKARAAFAAQNGNRPAPLTAAGCFCGPDELIRETGVVGRRGRPFAAMFPTIAISGGFRAMPDLAFNVDTGLRSGVTQWTCVDQSAVDAADPDTWKPCADLECFTEETYEPYAVTACVTAERFHKWAHPEQVDAWINLLGIEYDALAETLLIDQVEGEAGTPFTIGAAGGLMEEHGMVAKIIYALANFAYPLGYQYREGAGVLDGYTLSVPVGMAEALYADEMMRGFPSGVESKEAIVAKIERGSGVRMVERLDESTSRKAAAAATVVALGAGGAIDANDTPLLPPSFRLYLIPLEGYVHGEGTLVNADWYTDDALIRQNRLRYFLENLEILVNLSVRKPYILDVPGVIVGAYTDLTEGPVPT